MSGNKIFIDTNICIYLLNGDTIIADLLHGYSVFISFITEIELYSYHGDSDAAKLILDSFISSVNILGISHDIKSCTIDIRKTRKLKIPDAIIAASALANELSLLTADKGLKSIDNLNVLLYAPN